MAFFANGGTNTSTGEQNADINPTPNAAQIGAGQYGRAFASDSLGSGIGGADAQQGQQYQGMLSTMALGQAPVAQVDQNNAATGQAQQFATAQGQSGRGQFGLAGAAHMGQQVGAGIGQAGAAQDQVLAQQQQYQGVQAQAQMQMQQRAQDLQASGLDAQTAQAQAQLESQQQQANNSTDWKIAKGILTGGMSTIFGF
jgi:hypothetical protein